MKILILTSALLFLTGTQGRFLWQNDEAESLERNAKKYADYFLTQYLKAVRDVVEYVESSEYFKQLKVKERIESVRTEVDDFWETVDKYVDGVAEEIHKEMLEDYPVLMTKVVPVLKEYKDQWERNALIVARDFSKMTWGLLAGIKTEFHNFFENLEPIAEKGHARLRAEVNDLRTRLAPYIDDLREELRKNDIKVREELHKLVKELREYIGKEVAAMPAIIKPYVDDVKEEIGAFIEELKKEINSRY